MNVLQVISLLPDNKENSELFSVKLMEILDSGEINPFDLLAVKKAMDNVFEVIKPMLDEMALSEAERYGEKEISYKGIKVTKAPVSTSYDYSQCGDLVYTDYKLKEAQLKMHITEREVFLKNMRDPMDIVDPETGDVIKVFPPIKRQKDGVKVSFSNLTP